MKKMIALMLCLLLCCTIAPALAEDALTLSGTVVSLQTSTLISPIGGAVSQVNVYAGQKINEGDTIALLETEKVYAQQDGIIYLFGQPGDTIDQITARYGSPAYLEPAYTYTISASTATAYDLEENRLVHPGEMVYLRGYTYTSHQGLGRVTTVSGTSFTVEVISGNFESSESVNIYRTENFAAKSRIGKGKTSRVDPIAYTSTGSLVAWHVENGQQVKKGDLLFETLEGAFQPGEEVSSAIKAMESGVIATVDIAPGTVLTADAAVISFYPDSALRIQAAVYEGDLASIQPGGRVKAEFSYGTGNETVMAGTIERISLLADTVSETTEEEEAASYAVYIRLDDPSAVHYGMHLLITPEN